MDYHYLLLLISIAGYRLGTETTHSPNSSEHFL